VAVKIAIFLTSFLACVIDLPHPRRCGDWPSPEIGEGLRSGGLWQRCPERPAGYALGATIGTSL
jgi:hypothetical protein